MQKILILLCFLLFSAVDQEAAEIESLEIDARDFFADMTGLYVQDASALNAKVVRLKGNKNLVYHINYFTKGYVTLTNLCKRHNFRFEAVVTNGTPSKTFSRISDQYLLGKDCHTEKNWVYMDPHMSGPIYVIKILQQLKEWASLRDFKTLCSAAENVYEGECNDISDGDLFGSLEEVKLDAQALAKLDKILITSIWRLPNEKWAHVTMEALDDQLKVTKIEIAVLFF